MNKNIDIVENPVLKVENLSIAYNKADKYAVKDVNVTFKKNTITAIMGPSGCGKSTMLRAINRMHELYPDIQTKGDIYLNEENIM